MLANMSNLHLRYTSIHTYVCLMYLMFFTMQIAFLDFLFNNQGLYMYVSKADNVALLFIQRIYLIW